MSRPLPTLTPISRSFAQAPVEPPAPQAPRVAPVAPPQNPVGLNPLDIFTLADVRRSGGARGGRNVLADAVRGVRALGDGELRQQGKILHQNVLKLLLNAVVASPENADEAVAVARDYLLGASAALTRSATARVGSRRPQEKGPLRSPEAWTLRFEAAQLAEAARDLGPGAPAQAMLMLELMERGVELGGQQPGGGLINVKQLFSMLRRLAEADTPSERQLVLLVAKQLFEPCFEELRGVGEHLAQHPDFRFNRPEVGDVIKSVLRGYVEGLGRERLAEMICDFISLEGEADINRLAGIIFRNTGPVFMKVLQNLGRIPELKGDLAKVLQGIEMDNKRVPRALVEELISKDKGGYRFEHVSFDPQDVHTGSVAQIHRAILRDQEGKLQEVAIRFIKPGLRELQQEEVPLIEKVLLDVLGNTPNLSLEVSSIGAMVEQVKGLVELDMDLVTTSAHQTQMQEVYQRKREVTLGRRGKTYTLDFRVAQIFPPPQGASQLMVQEYISPGMSFSDFAEQSPVLAGEIGTELGLLFLEAALLRPGGRFHGDLHQGNFRISPNWEQRSITIPIYDFGITGELNEAQQRAFFIVALAVVKQNRKQIAEALLTLSSGKEPTREELKALLAEMDEEVQRRAARGGPPHRADEWIGWFIGQGHPMPQALGAFARSMGLLIQVFKKVDIEDTFGQALTPLLLKALRGRVLGGELKLPVGMGALVSAGWHLL